MSPITHFSGRTLKTSPPPFVPFLFYQLNTLIFFFPDSLCQYLHVFNNSLFRSCPQSINFHFHSLPTLSSSSIFFLFSLQLSMSLSILFSRSSLIFFPCFLYHFPSSFSSYFINFNVYLYFFSQLSPIFFSCFLSHFCRHSFSVSSTSLYIIFVTSLSDILLMFRLSFPTDVSFLFHHLHCLAFFLPSL